MLLEMRRYLDKGESFTFETTLSGRTVARERAEKIRELWATQDGLWTEEGLKLARAIAKGEQ